jgi:hypothetical protein
LGSTARDENRKKAEKNCQPKRRPDAGRDYISMSIVIGHSADAFSTADADGVIGRIAGLNLFDSKGLQSDFERAGPYF